VSEQLGAADLAALVEDAGDAVVVADADGAIRFWNRAAEAMFGHAREDVLGVSLDVIIPERLRERHWDGFRHTMATGETRYGGRTLSVPAMRADGTRISVEFTVALLRDETGAVRGIGAIMRDVTERWERDRATLRELEALRARSAEG
jgi:PAS domain S-box-containing protein